VQTRANIHGSHRSTTVATAGIEDRIRSIARIVTVLGALLIEALLILGCVVLSLGIGAEGRPGIGPDRPPPPMPAPAPPPDPGPILALSVAADRRSALRTGRGA
jgi:hypothetical protein